MSILGAITKRNAASALDDSWYSPGGIFYGGAGIPTKAGTSVSELNAMQLSIVWCCVRILSEDSASLPLHLYRRLKGGGKERATDHPLYKILHDAPNPEMTAFSFRESLKSHRLTWGNAYAEIEYGRGSVGKKIVKALWPITPHRVTPKRDENRKKIYHISMAGTGLQDVVLPAEKVLHIPGLGYDGLKGYSPIAMAQQSIGLGMALEEFGSTYFGSGVHPGMVVSHPKSLDPDAMKRLNKVLSEEYATLGRAHRLMLLTEGMTMEKIGIPNDEAQFLETRRYQNIDIGTRIYRVPPYMYGEMDKTAFANVEQQAIDYVTKTLRPDLVREEQSLNMSLLSESERGEYFFEHLIDGLLRGDIKSRSEAYAIGRQWGWLNADDICELENRNPLPDGQGKVYLSPLNMVPAQNVGKQQDGNTDKQDNGDIAQNNRRTYRERIENAYRGMIADAIGRVTRQEAQRVNWLLKNNKNVDEFYRDFGDYIEKQLKPVISCYADAIIVMESELNGAKYDDFEAGIQRFTDVCTNNYAAEYVEQSRKIDINGNEWTERDVASEAETQTTAFANKIINYLDGITGKIS